MVQNIIDVKNLSKSFDISSKEPGLKGTIKHFFRRQKKSIKVIKDITFKLFVRLLKKCLIVPFKPGSLEEISNDLDKFLTSIIFFTI